MTDRPDDTALWATDGDNTLEPSAGKRASGWLPGEAPPAQFFNWWKNLVGRWVAYLDEQIAAIEIPDISDVARLHGSNTFHDLIAVEVPDAGRGILGTGITPADDPRQASAGPAWMLVEYFKHSGGQYVYLYSGRNAGDANGAFAVVTNCEWNVDLRQWEQRTNTLPSCALLWFYGKVRVTGVPAGAVPWADWPTTSAAGAGDLDVAGSVDIKGALAAVGSISTPNDITAGDDIAAAGDITAGGDLTSTGGSVVANHGLFSGNIAAPAGNVTAGGEFRYPSWRDYVIEVPMPSGVAGFPAGDSPSWNWNPGFGFWTANGTTWELSFPLDELPAGHQLVGVDLLVQQSDATSPTAELRRRNNDWATIGEPDYDPFPLSESGSATPDWYKLTVDLSPVEQVGNDTTYDVAVRAGHSGDSVARLRLRVRSPGPGPR